MIYQVEYSVPDTYAFEYHTSINNSYEYLVKTEKLESWFRLGFLF